MRLKIVSIILLLTMSLLLQAYPAFADTYNPDRPVVYVQGTFDGHQSWATYPSPGGNFSPLDRGTDFFVVAPGTTIYRKILVHNSLPFNDSFTINVTGLDPSWIVSIQQIRGRTSTQVVSSLYYPQHYPAVNVHQGYGGIFISPPVGTPAGRYHYDVYVTSVSNPSYFGRLSGGDWIVVGETSPSPSPSPSVSPTPTPTPTPSPTATVPYGSAVVSESIPGTFTVGTGQAASVTMRNTGYTAWDKSVSIWVEGADAASKAAIKPVRLGIPLNTRIGNGGTYTWNFMMKTYSTAASGTYRVYYTLIRNNSTASAFGQRVEKSVTVGSGTGPSPTPRPSASPTVSPSPSPTVARGYLMDGNFESGNLNNWTLAGGNNYKKDMMVAENRVVARGMYGLGKRAYDVNDPLDRSQAYLYSRVGQPVSYNGRGYSFSFYFYIDPADQGKGSVWGSVSSNPVNINDLNSMRSVGYNHISNMNGQFQYQYGAPDSGSPRYRSFTTAVPARGWYIGNITYTGDITTFSLLYGNGTLIESGSISDPGFVPGAVIANIASPRFYMDEMSYSSR